MTETNIQLEKITLPSISISVQSNEAWFSIDAHTRKDKFNRSQQRQKGIFCENGR